jgi:hypothetical protein
VLAGISKLDMNAREARQPGGRGFGGIFFGFLLLILATQFGLASHSLGSQRPAYVNVRWVSAIDAFTQAQAEYAHGLARRRPLAERTWEYYLTDLSPSNLERIVRDPAVEDTHFIDRGAFRIATNATRGPYPAKWHATAARALDSAFRLSLLVGCLMIGFGVSRAARRHGSGDASASSPGVVDAFAIGHRRVAIDTVLLLILIGAVACRLYLASTADYIHDEDNTAIPLAKSISFAPGAVNLPLRGENHGALPAYVVKASAALFGTSPLGYRALHVLLGLCAVLMVYVVTRDTYGRVAARWAAALLAFNEYFLAFSSRATANTPYLFLVTAAVLAFGRFLTHERPVWLYGAAVATGLAFYCKEHAVLLLPVFGVLLLIHHRRWLRRQHTYLAVALFLLIVTPDLLWNARTDPETARVTYSASYVAQANYAAHLRRIGGLGLSPYPAMFYAREPVTRLVEWATGGKVPDVAGYPSINPVLGVLLVVAVLATTFGTGPRSVERRLLLTLAWGVFLFFTLIRKGDPPNRLSSVSWVWVESTLIPAVVIGGAWLSTLRGRWRVTAWGACALALFYAANSLLWPPPG